MNTKFIMVIIIVGVFIVGAVMTFAFTQSAMQKQLLSLDVALASADRKMNSNQLLLRDLALRQGITQNQIALALEVARQSAAANTIITTQTKPTVTQLINTATKSQVTTPAPTVVQPVSKPAPVVRRTRAS